MECVESVESGMCGIWNLESGMWCVECVECGMDGSSGFQFCNAEDEGGCNLPAVTMVANALTYFYVPWMVLYYTWVFLVMGTYRRMLFLETTNDTTLRNNPSRTLLEV